MSVKLPDRMCWQVWRIFAEKGISPLEIETYWTVGMVIDANEVLDAMIEVKLKAMGE